MKEPFKSFEKSLLQLSTLITSEDRRGTPVMARGPKWAPEAKIKFVAVEKL